MNLVKVVCIKNCEYDSSYCYVGEKYLVSNFAGINYYFVYKDSKTFYGAFERECFVLLSEHRDKQLNEILND